MCLMFLLRLAKVLVLPDRIELSTSPLLRELLRRAFAGDEDRLTIPQVPAPTDGPKNEDGTKSTDFPRITLPCSADVRRILPNRPTAHPAAMLHFCGFDGGRDRD